MSDIVKLLPSYWLLRPPLELDAATRRAFDELLDRSTERGPAAPIDYTLDAPKWQFLCYLADERGLALHGSPNPDIAVFEPRQPHDLREFGDQRAVYAAADGIWPLYFAILDRERFPTALNNACISLTLPDGSKAGPYYMFSIGRHVIDKRPYRNGVVYLLPRAGFVAEPPMPFGAAEVRTTQLASTEPVTPLAKLAVAPQDFPFLEQMRAHDDQRLAEYAQAMQTGAPWPDEVEDR